MRGPHRPKIPVSKIVKIGYFWPTMQRDAKEFVERCNKC